MPIEVETAMIAVAGVVIAAAVSYLTSRRQAKIEIQKFRAETERTYGSMLYERRLRVYPEMYSQISDFIKLMQYGTVTNAAVNKFFEGWLEWDSRNAILFSAFTHGVCSLVRHGFDALLEKSDEELQREFNSEQSRAALKKQLQAVELVLRYELGVFAYEAPDVEKLKRHLSYEEAHASAGLDAIKSFLAESETQEQKAIISEKAAS